MLTTIENIESYLGSVLDSSESAVYTAIIEAVSAYIESQCDTEFTEANYVERLQIADGLATVRNRLQYIFQATVADEDAIDVTGPVLGSMDIQRDGDTLTVRLISGLSATSINASVMTLSSLATAIDAVSGWTATYTGDRNILALSISPNYQRNEDGSFTILAPQEPVLLSKLTDRVLRSDIQSGDGVIVYKGGYDTVPADLEDLATRMVIQAYTTRQTAATGVIKKQELGDWAETYLTPGELQNAAGTIVNYKAVIDSYRNYSI